MAKAKKKKPVAKKKVVKKVKAVKAKPKAKKAAPKKVSKAKAKPAKKTAAKAAPAPKPAVKAKPVPVPPKKPVLVNPKNTGTKQFTQSEFYDCVQGCCGFHNRKAAKEFYESFSGLLTDALKSGYKIVMPGIGKIQVRRTKARRGINPATQEPIMIKAKNKVAFTANKALKEAVLK